MTRAAAATAVLLLTGCSSNQADVGEQLRRIQAQELEDAKARALGNADPLTESARTRLETDVRVLEQRLAEAERGTSPSAVAAASTALDQARRQLAAEVDRQRKLEDLRARTPKRLIKLESSPSAASRSASSPSSRWFGGESAPASRSKPASRPDSRPAASAEELAEFERLEARIRYLADLRNSAGDRAGSARVKRDLVKYIEEFKMRDRAKALESLRRLERDADR